MPTRKIADRLEDLRCRHPDHDPPKMRVFSPGVYEHECPGCGKVQVFYVAGADLENDCSQLK